MGIKSISRKFLASLAKRYGYALVNEKELLKLKGNQAFNKYIENQKYLEYPEFRYILWLDRIYQKIVKVPGHIVELGVAYGRNSIIFSNLIKMNGDDMVRKYYGFDTFKGYTEESLSIDKHLGKENWKDNSKDYVWDKLVRLGHRDICELIEGDIVAKVPEFLENRPNFRIALLYVDCNAYLPAIKGMDFFKEYMMPGGVICTDEKYPSAETKALLEFCKKNNLELIKDNSAYSIPAYTIVK